METKDLKCWFESLFLIQMSLGLDNSFLCYSKICSRDSTGNSEKPLTKNFQARMQVHLMLSIILIREPSLKDSTMLFLQETGTSSVSEWNELESLKKLLVYLSLPVWVQ